MDLEVENLSLAYGKNIVVRNVCLRVTHGEMVALLGHNGAGKTTILKGIVGLLKPIEGVVRFDQTYIMGSPPSENVRRGIFYLGTQNSNFPDLSVMTNLELAAYTVNDPSVVESRSSEIFQLFPILKSRIKQKARTLSGGEKKMLEISMAIMTQPKLFLVDEPSLGLSPILVREVMNLMVEINKRYGTSILLVEQNVVQALSIVDRAYVVKIGEIILQDAAENLRKQGHGLFNLF